MLKTPVNGKIQGLFKAFECFSSTFQGKFNFQGLLKTVLYIQVLFKPVRTLLGPDQAQQNVWQSDRIPEIIFRKSWFWKKSADNKKRGKFSQVAELAISSIFDPWNLNVTRINFEFQRIHKIHDLPESRLALFTLKVPIKTAMDSKFWNTLPFWGKIRFDKTLPPIVCKQMIIQSYMFSWSSMSSAAIFTNTLRVKGFKYMYEICNM